MPVNRLFPYVKLRRRDDGSIRPRFSPGPRERGPGFKAEDLKHPDGRWFNLDEASAFAQKRLGEILARRNGEKPIGAVAVTSSRTVGALIDAFLRSPDVARLAPRTRRDYEAKADAVRFRPRSWADKAAGVRQMPEPIAATPARALMPPEAKMFFEYLVAARGLAMARGAIAVLSAAYSWARLSPDWRLTVNPCKELNLPTPAPRLVIWRVEEVAGFVAAADAAGLASLGDAVMIALFSGQRQGDVLALVDAAGSDPRIKSEGSLAQRVATGDPLRLVQGKTSARVSVFATPELVARLGAAEARRRMRAVALVGDVPIVLREDTGEAWNEHAFRKAFAGIRTTAAASLPTIADRRFQDLRDTAVTWLARAGCTIPEICAITGHSLQSATTILKHYLELGEPLAREAIRKMVEWMDREGMKL